MLNILTGRAGSGKSRAVFRRMAAEGAARPQILLVPEQASFETERRFCRGERQPGGGLWGGPLLHPAGEPGSSPRQGAGPGRLLDEGGRLLAMYAALQGVQGRLTVYAMPSRRPSSWTALLTTLDELRCCCVHRGTAGPHRGGDRGPGRGKAPGPGADLRGLRGHDRPGPPGPRDRLTRLAEALRSCPFFRGKDVYLDGFTDFTLQQSLVLEEILRQAHTVTLALTCGEGEGAVFAPARRTVAQLKRLAARVGCPVGEEALPGAAQGRTSPWPGWRLTSSTQPPAPYPGPWDGSVTVARLPSPREEAAWAAGEIQALVRSGRYRYRDIAVAARSLEPYWEGLEEAFRQYGVPLFQAQRTDILQKPIFTLITAALEAVTGGLCL